MSAGAALRAGRASGAGSFVRVTGAEDSFRIEHDTMGEVRVPASALWAAQTQS
jgi:hypothetical protein